MDALDQTIAAKTKEAESLRTQLRVLEAEIAALQLAAELRPATRSSGGLARSSRGAVASHGRRGGGRRKGDISHDWRAILEEMFRRAASIDYAEISEIAASHGKALEIPSIRDRLRNMAKTGLVVGNAEEGFLVTDEAAARFGFTKRNDPPEGGSDGEVDASPEESERDRDGDPHSIFS